MGVPIIIWVITASGVLIDAQERTHIVGDVVGPVYYNICLDDFIVFGTTIEKGEGDQDGYGRLYAIDSNDHLQEIWKQRERQMECYLIWIWKF